MDIPVARLAQSQRRLRIGDEFAADANDDARAGGLDRDRMLGPGIRLPFIPGMKAAAAAGSGERASHRLRAMPEGPLSGVKVVEIASIGPGPFAAMMLADLGADVVRLERGGAGGLGAGAWNYVHRGRPSVGCDLKNPEAREMVLRLCESADALIEGFRPGVMEKLGVGPDEALARNPKLVYGRMTGYGQDGPMARVAGHDINYISLAGALGQFQRTGEKPLAPINMVGDYGGGGMLLALGVLAAILEARCSGKGQVVDAAMVEGSAVLMTMIHALKDIGMWGEPGTNLLDSGAHFYDTYECKDGGFVAIGAIEPQFYAELMRCSSSTRRSSRRWIRPAGPSSSSASPRSS